MRHVQRYIYCMLKRVQQIPAADADAPTPPAGSEVAPASGLRIAGVRCGVFGGECALKSGDFALKSGVFVLLGRWGDSALLV